jgi:hypothetical protein
MQELHNIVLLLIWINSTITVTSSRYHELVFSTVLFRKVSIVSMGRGKEKRGRKGKEKVVRGSRDVTRRRRKRVRHWGKAEKVGERKRRRVIGVYQRDGERRRSCGKRMKKDVREVENSYM